MPEIGFTDGDVVTAANLNQIEDQLIVTCTSSTRPSGVEGRMVYETDTDRLLLHNGTVYQTPTTAIERFGLYDYNDASIPNNTTTALTLEALFDPESWLSGGNIVPDLQGWYQITVAAVWPTTASNRFLIAIRKNGTDLATGVSNIEGPSAGNPTNQIATAVFMNGTTDALDLRALHVVGSGQVLSGLLVSTRFIGNP